MKNNSFMHNCIKGLGIMFRSEPRMLLLQILFAFLHGLSWTLQVIFTQKFFDVAQNAVQKNTSMNNCIIYLMTLIASYVFCQIMNGVDNCHGNILNFAMTKHIKLKIFKKIDRMECIDFENTKRLDFINKGICGGENLVWVCLTLIDTIFFYATYFVMMGIYLFTLNPILSISILVIFIPSALSNIIQTKSFKDLENKSAPIRRECDYYKGCVSDLRETRLLGATQYFRSLYLSCLKKLNNLIFKIQLRKNIINFCLDSITALGYGIILFMLIILVLRQEITVGAFAAVLSTIGRLYSFMSEVISERINWAYENVATLENFIEFITEEDEIKQKKIKLEQSDIILKDVSFKYPESKNYALNNIDLVIKKGQKIAIVGENGSGKSTFCKLLLGIYSPSKGEIFMGNISLPEIKNENVSVIYQDYCKYKMTLKENILISKTNKSYSNIEIERICKEAGVDLDDSKLTDGFETMLGRDFDGIELSGGQWQRLAIARGIYRPYDFIVLDEPTSAIDPLEETYLYQKFMDISAGKTAIIVTHRLGIAKIADYILVMKDGGIAEQGTHAELMELNGEYKMMFNIQSQQYT